MQSRAFGSRCGAPSRRRRTVRGDRHARDGGLGAFDRPRGGCERCTITRRAKEITQRHTKTHARRGTQAARGRTALSANDAREACRVPVRGVSGPCWHKLILHRSSLSSVLHGPVLMRLVLRGFVASGPVWQRLAWQRLAWQHPASQHLVRRPSACLDRVDAGSSRRSPRRLFSRFFPPPFFFFFFFLPVRLGRRWGLRVSVRVRRLPGGPRRGPLGRSPL